MTKAQKDEKVWKIIDQYENDEIGFGEAIELFADLNKNDVYETIADLECMLCGVLTKESREQVSAVIEKRKGGK